MRKHVDPVKKIAEHVGAAYGLSVTAKATAHDINPESREHHGIPSDTRAKDDRMTLVIERMPDLRLSAAAQGRNQDFPETGAERRPTHTMRLSRAEDPKREREPPFAFRRDLTPDECRFYYINEKNVGRPKAARGWGEPSKDRRTLVMEVKGLGHLAIFPKI